MIPDTEKESSNINPKTGQAEKAGTSNHSGALKLNNPVRPLRVLIVTLSAIFIAEMLVMYGLHHLRPMPPIIEALVDALSLSIIVFPLLIVLAYLPMKRDLLNRTLIAESLAKHRDHLDELVTKRTITLTRVNEQLQDEIAERTKTQTVLKESEERYRLIVDNTDTGFVVVDEKGAVVEANEPYLRLIGAVHLDDIISRSVIEWTAPECQEENSAAVARCAKQGYIRDFETTYLHIDGTRVHILINAIMHDTSKGIRLAAQCRDITERKQAEEALQESENKLLEAQRIARLGHYVLDIKTSCWTSSAELDKIFGIDKSYKKDIDGWLQIVHPEHRDTMANYFQDDVSGHHREFDKEYKIVDATTGQEKWVHGLGSLKFDENGNPVQMFGTIQDITERKRDEQILRDNNRLFKALDEINTMYISNVSYKAIFDKLLSYFLSLSQSEYGFIGEVLYKSDGTPYLKTHAITDIAWNEETRKLYEENAQNGLEFYNLKTLMGVVMTSGEPVISNEPGTDPRRGGLPKGHPPLNAFLGLPIYSHGTMVGMVGVSNRPGGYDNDLLAYLQPIVATCGSIIGAHGSMQKRQHAEKKLRESEHQYQELIDSILEGICLTDENEVILFCNPAFATIFGEDSPEITVGKNFLDYLSEDQIPKVLAETDKRKKGESSQYELHITTSKGEKKTILTWVTPRFDEEKRFVSSLCALTDVTEIKRLQELESRAERLETAGIIAGQVAHDFNNLLAPLMAYPEFIRDKLPHDHSAHPYLDAIEEAAIKIANINQDLLTMGRRGHYNLKIVDLNRVVLQAAREMESRTKTVTVEMNLCEDLMKIKGGEAQIHRMLTNLLANAQDAMEDIGRVTITTENYYADDTSVAFGQVPKGEYVKLTVSDNGCGIPDNIKQKILDPFFSTKTTDKKRGSGLGLSVVDAVMKDHNGYLDLSSNVGHGTSFYLYFPITREGAAEDASEQLGGGTETVLVVDDDDIQREVSSRLLTKLGYKVSSVESGEKAVEFLRENPQNLVILDMVMPGGIDGAETYQQILEINPHQKAILLSGFSESERVLEAQRLGAGAFIRKPVTKSAIAAAVRTELDRQVKAVTS